MSDEPSYEVGYGRPPRHTRFRKGRSGNPRGRRKGARNLASLIAEALDRQVVVSGNAEHPTISKLEAIIAELVDKSAAADLKAMAMLFGLIRPIQTTGHAPPGRSPGRPPAATTAFNTAADHAVIKNLIARIRGT